MKLNKKYNHYFVKKKIRAMSEFSSSEQLKSLHSSLSDIYVDIETNILQKGQVVERFIQSHQNDENKTVCFSLLQTLFSLFKSEFMTNLLLRKELIAHREIYKKDQNYTNSIELFLQRFHHNFPNLYQHANSLEEINQFSKKLFRQLDKLSNNNIKKEILQDLIKQKKQLQQKNAALKQECLDIQQNGDIQFAEKQQFFQNLRLNEEDLTDKVNSLLKEHSELEKMTHNFSNIDDLQYKIKDVDQKVITIVSNMTTMKAKFRRKITKMKMKIEKYQIDIKELKENRVDLEKELDSIQAKIDFLNNPLAIPNDESIISPHEERFQLIEMQKNLKNLKQLKTENDLNIEQSESQIKDLTNFLMESNEKIYEKTIQLENLNKIYEKQQNVFQYIKENQTKISRIQDQLKVLNETKRSLNFDKIRLNHKLDELMPHWRQLAIDNKQLLKTEAFLENEKNKATNEIKQSTLSDFDKEMFESVLDAMRKLREELLLSLNTPPREIADIIVKHVNSI